MVENVLRMVENGWEWVENGLRMVKNGLRMVENGWDSVRRLRESGQLISVFVFSVYVFLKICGILKPRGL